ncbi:MAG: AMP-binding protein [Bacteroidota bacterium]
MSIIYLENQYQINSKELAQIDQASDIPYLSQVDKSLQAALKFAWQWLRGKDGFEQATSGSTSTPKVIRLHRDQMITSARMTLQALGLGKKDSALLCLHAQYIGGKMMIVRSLLADMDIVFIRPTSNPLSYLPFLPTFAAMVPLQIQTLLEGGKASQLNLMSAIIVGGAPISATLEKQISEQLTIPVYNTYGMTETVSHIALRKLTPPNVSDVFQVLDKTQIALDERGCLKIKGKVTRDQWLVTNDLVEIENDNSFRWLGRYDSVINSGGVKVMPEQIEKVLEPILQAQNYISRFLVSSLLDEKLGERIVLILECDTLSKSFEKRILGQAAQRLSKYQLPKAIYYLPKFSETSTNKIKRRQTQRLLLQSLA